MAQKPLKLKETPHAAPEGAVIFDADYIVIGGKAPPRHGPFARMQRAIVRFALAVLVAAILGALVPPLLIAAEIAKR